MFNIQSTNYKNKEKKDNVQKRKERLRKNGSNRETFSIKSRFVTHNIQDISNYLIFF